MLYKDDSVIPRSLWKQSFLSPTEILIGFIYPHNPPPSPTASSSIYRNNPTDGKCGNYAKTWISLQDEVKQNFPCSA